MAISDKTRKILWALSGARCARNFAKLIERGVKNPSAFVVGEEAHIVAREDDGPRGDPSFPKDLRDELENLILLCPTCHTIVDEVPEDYPVAALHTMRAEHEAKIEALIASSSPEVAERQAIAAYYQVF